MVSAWKALGLAALLAASGGCKTTEPVTTTVVRTVDKPVKVPCLKESQVPKQPTRLSEDLTAPPSTLTEMVGRLRAKLKEWQDLYGPVSQDLLTICSRLPSPAASPSPSP